MVYSALLPLVTALFGLGSGIILFFVKKRVLTKYMLLLLSIILLTIYAYAVFVGLTTYRIILWQASIAFLSTAILTGMFFTIQLIRDVRETDSIFLLLYFISTTAGVLSIEKTVEISGVHLPSASPSFFGLFFVFVVISWGEVLYNMIIARIASEKTELKKYRIKVNYLFAALNIIFALITIDAILICTNVHIIPLVSVFATIPIALFIFFMCT